MSQTVIKVQQEKFDIGSETEALRADEASCGAIVTFTGIVRELATGESLEKMFLEHYPGMTEKALASIVEQARARWPLGAVTVIHRVGELSPNENIVFVGVASAHRKAAFAASQFIMDYLKRDAPFWKKEITASNSDWVAQKNSDLDAANEW